MRSSRFSQRWTVSPRNSGAHDPADETRPSVSRAARASRTLHRRQDHAGLRGERNPANHILTGPGSIHDSHKVYYGIYLSLEKSTAWRRLLDFGMNFDPHVIRLSLAPAARCFAAAFAAFPGIAISARSNENADDLTGFDPYRIGSMGLMRLTTTRSISEERE